MEPIKMLTRELNGRRVDYTSDVVFTVEVGRGRGKYDRRGVFVGDLPRAVMFYNCINIGRGHKKRLVMGPGRTVLARADS